MTPTAIRDSFFVQRSGKNKDGYAGDTINICEVLRGIEQAAHVTGWSSERFLETDRLQLIALQRSCEKPARRIYISAGIHGNEPASPLAARQLLMENKWPAGVEIWLCPCLNPTGFPLNRRENSQGIDLNRQYRQPETDEVRAHVAWLARQPDFDLALCLHEDWEAQGFYIYELNPDHRPSLAEVIIRSAASVCPIDPSEVIEGRLAQNGIIRPAYSPGERPQWPEAFYLIENKTRLNYTLEAPSDFPLTLRVNALVAGVNAALVTPGK
jgi:murein peptide amidase A